MRRARHTVLVLAVAATGVSASVAVAQRHAAPLWGPAITAWHLPTGGPNRIQLVDKQVGVGNYVDDTKVITYTDINGKTETTNSSPWTVVDVTKAGVPAKAKAIRLTLKGIITKGQSDGLATVYVMTRPFGSNCCQGPPGFRHYPVDIQLAEGRQVESVLQSLAQRATDGRRDWVTVDVPLNHGKFEFAWGYRRVGGAWPVGDGVAFEMFANGYGT
jgi:hypothetical protein